MESKVYLSAGSNVGDRISYLKSALSKANSKNDISVQNISSIYETLPFGKTDQNNFKNIVISLRTTLSYLELFKEIKNIEKEIGRSKTERWGPREIDIDILLFDDKIIDTDKLTIPHKGILERDFVVKPLLEIEPEISHPVKQKKIKDLLYLLASKTIINKTPNSILGITEITDE
ncbi:MAG: 2-amino-4-hydroxy-6-hydroxymethyldihydropteridine diphosphokinase [Ignavibacteriae bacterium]|nr:2-amino-4-hydroxy-6-hydroxymethyldihydropteridine diphosphokinase [Ignavibacteriota bacterium]NOG96386.1 2-amino-4-hydroxy-6-hydroxymethyldihydropteridine diphosphokinase [Ignavibacteriota bacterium]